MNTAPDDSFMRGLLEAIENPDAEPFVLRRFGPEEAMRAAPHLAGVIRIWDERRGGRPTPDWADMEFADFRGWHPALVVSDLPAGEPDPIYRIVGEDFRIVSYTTKPGQRFSDRTPLLYERQFREHFGLVRDTGLIGWSVGPAALVGREHVRLRVMELPFTNGGQAVSRLAHIMTYRFDGGD
ncbi:hypothetical protein SAMN06265365_1038 [Tistlia consotensis]|uniref:PAS domain-containing protein n=1 Tax=Tistlia consotensis USBA 355 TaxID=560819 RepID=A0A1Y6BUI4_9PROT|nr:hypothetical protein [Tistlia consotensis]SMF19294.1 hypothetical protein SAMN05428998_106217 [Tistlia consotensis USBA 355]SNR39082.1 hypothetical protein SAMN06265365_1038 [Tistlia consotensis]